MYTTTEKRLAPSLPLEHFTTCMKLEGSDLLGHSLSYKLAAREWPPVIASFDMTDNRVGKYGYWLNKLL